MEEIKNVEMENEFTIVASDETEYLHTTTSDDETEVVEYVPVETEEDVITNQQPDEVMTFRLFTGNIVSLPLSDIDWTDVFNNRIGLTQDIETVLNLFHVIISNESENISEEDASFIDEMLEHVNLSSLDINYKLRENMTERDVMLLKLLNIYQVLSSISNTATITSIRNDNVVDSYPIQYLVSPALLLPDDVSNDTNEAEINEEE
jgi:hypothetical protein